MSGRRQILLPLFDTEPPFDVVATYCFPLGEDGYVPRAGDLVRPYEGGPPIPVREVDHVARGRGVLTTSHLLRWRRTPALVEQLAAAGWHLLEGP